MAHDVFRDPVIISTHFSHPEIQSDGKDIDFQGWSRDAFEAIIRNVLTEIYTIMSENRGQRLVVWNIMLHYTDKKGKKCDFPVPAIIRPEYMEAWTWEEITPWNDFPHENEIHETIKMKEKVMHILMLCIWIAPKKKQQNREMNLKKEKKKIQKTLYDLVLESMRARAKFALAKKKEKEKPTSR